jgi:hypothetical protein
MSCNAQSALVFKTTPTFKICYKKNKTKTNVLVVPGVLLYLKQLPTFKICNNKNKCLVAPGVLWYLKQLLYSNLLKNLTHLQNLNVTVLYMKISGTKFVLYFFIYYAHAETTSITAVRRAIKLYHYGYV